MKTVTIDGKTFTERDAAEVVVRSFYWPMTERGVDYWEAVCDSLGGYFDHGTGEEREFDKKVYFASDRKKLYKDIVKAFLNDEEYTEYCKEVENWK